MAESSETAGSNETEVTADPDREIPDPQQYAISQPCTHEEFLAVAKVYARDVVQVYDLSVSVSGLSWEVSTRARRRAGVITYRDGEPQCIKLAWKQFETQGWEATASTVRHELIHAHLLNEGVGSGHGPEFERMAEQLETPVHCERFSDPKWWVHCTECETKLARYRRSKVVKNPGEYQCRSCGGALRIQAND